MDFQIPTIGEDVKLDISEKDGPFIETVFIQELLNVIIDFINKLIKFEFKF